MGDQFLFWALGCWQLPAALAGLFAHRAPSLMNPTHAVALCAIPREFPESCGTLTQSPTTNSFSRALTAYWPLMFPQTLLRASCSGPLDGVSRVPSTPALHFDSGFALTSLRNIHTPAENTATTSSVVRMAGTAPAPWPFHLSADGTFQIKAVSQHTWCSTCRRHGS